MADIFISYSHEDQGFVRRMVPALEAEGFSVWWDHTIPPGQSWDSFIARGIKEAKVAIVVWSQTSIASEWVKEEASIARGTGKYLPVQIHGSDPPIGFSRIQAAQLIGWDGSANDSQWLMLMGEVRRIMAEGGSVTPAPRRNASRASGTSHTPAKKSAPVAAILLTLALLVGAGGAAGYFYLNQSGVGSEAKVETIAAENELAELRRQMEETQAALAEERRLREEAEKQRNRPQPTATVQHRPTASAASTSPPPPLDIAGSWRGNIDWSSTGADGTPRDGAVTYVFHSDGTVVTGTGSRGTWSSDGQNLNWQFGRSRYRAILRESRISGSALRDDGSTAIIELTR